MTAGTAPVEESAVAITACGTADAVWLKPTTVVISTTTVVMESVLELTVGNIGSKILFPKFPVDPADLATLPESERT
jgi:hypothetical protein